MWQFETKSDGKVSFNSAFCMKCVLVSLSPHFTSPSLRVKVVPEVGWSVNLTCIRDNVIFRRKRFILRNGCITHIRLPFGLEIANPLHIGTGSTFSSVLFRACLKALPFIEAAAKHRDLIMAKQLKTTFCRLYYHRRERNLMSKNESE